MDEFALDEFALDEGERTSIVLVEAAKKLESCSSYDEDMEDDEESLSLSSGEAKDQFPSSLNSSAHSTRSWHDSFADIREKVANATYVPISRQSKVFRTIDKNCDRKASKEEIQEWIKTNPSLWGMLSVNLNLEEEECVDIATRVFMRINAETETTTTNRRYQDNKDLVTKDQFKSIVNQYIDDPKGSQEFFHRSVFAAYDGDGSNTLDREEFERFIDVFYEPGSIFRGDARLPPKEELLRILYKKYDANDDGLFTFDEVKPIISGLAFQSIFNSNSGGGGDPSPEKGESKSNHEPEKEEETPESSAPSTIANSKGNNPATMSTANKDIPANFSAPPMSSLKRKSSRTMVSPIIVKRGVNKSAADILDGENQSNSEKGNSSGTILGLIFWSSNDENEDSSANPIDDTTTSSTDESHNNNKSEKKSKGRTILGSLFWHEDDFKKEEEEEATKEKEKEERNNNGGKHFKFIPKGKRVEKPKDIEIQKSQKICDMIDLMEKQSASDPAAYLFE